MDATTKKKLNRLLQPQTIALHRWLERNAKILADRGTHAGEAAKQATDALGFNITEANVKSIAGMQATCSIKHQWPGYAAQVVRDGVPSSADDRLERIEAKVGEILKIVSAKGKTLFVT